jgi:uncharacterized Zn-finger protein
MLAALHGSLGRTNSTAAAAAAASNVSGGGGGSSPRCGRPGGALLACSQCGAGFSTSGNLRIHMLDQHSGARIKWHCHICNITFKNRSSLRAHLFKYHKMKVWELLAMQNSQDRDDEKGNVAVKRSNSPSQLISPHDGIHFLGKLS